MQRHTFFLSIHLNSFHRSQWLWEREKWKRKPKVNHWLLAVYDVSVAVCFCVWMVLQSLFQSASRCIWLQLDAGIVSRDNFTTGPNQKNSVAAMRFAIATKDNEMRGELRVGIKKILCAQWLIPSKKRWNVTFSFSSIVDWDCTLREPP